MQWICRWFWIVRTFEQSSQNLWKWDIFPFIWVFISFTMFYSVYCTDSLTLVLKLFPVIIFDAVLDGIFFFYISLLGICCHYMETQQSLCILYTANLLNLFILKIFCRVLRIFLYIICHLQIKCFLLLFIFGCHFSWLIALARTSRTMLNKSGHWTYSSYF